jgi:ubiquinone/menaquinone biosynthesis C-methylase UbiE
MIKGQEDIQKAYQDELVAREYVSTRFVSPLGAMLHSRQARTLQRVIRNHSIREAVEIAPGPARLTVDIAPLLDRVTLVDSSKEMLNEAARRLGERGLSGRTRLVLGDAFDLSLGECFELAYTFRLIRHFERPDRIKLYRQVFSLLKPRGWLVFDAVNEVVSARLRAARPEEYLHFDALLTPQALRDELKESGFEEVSLVAVQHHYPLLMECQKYLASRAPTLARAAMEIVDRFGGQPLEWVAVCRRG